VTPIITGGQVELLSAGISSAGDAAARARVACVPPSNLPRSGGGGGQPVPASWLILFGLVATLAAGVDLARRRYGAMRRAG